VEGAMFAFLAKLHLVVRSRLKSRARLEAENLVLRQQVIVLSGVRDEDRGASGQKQGWCIRRKAEGPKTETADFIGALKSPFLSVVHGVSRPHHW
jgi:hypothetical protein